MNVQILWNPESGRCSACGGRFNHTRLFTSGGLGHPYCKSCWLLLVEECNVPAGLWQTTVIEDWASDIALELVFEEDDGTAQGSGFWN